jgi:CRP/FNR family transcriptional regulator
MMPPMPVDAVEALSRVPLLAGIERRHLERLSRQFRERTFPEGHVVTREGESGAGFFVIVEGSATVTVGGDVRTALRAGDSFGEMALIDEGPRTATVVAATDLRCLALSPWDFRPFIEEHPKVAWSMLQTLARRLREIEAQAG